MAHRLRVFILLASITFSFNTLFASSWSDFGNYKYTWYTNDADLYISTAEELAGVAYLVNNRFTDFEGQTIHITKGIWLQNHYWTSIGLQYTFKGSINGHGNYVHGLNADPTNGSSGFIGYMAKGKIEGLYFEGIYADSQVTSGLVVKKASDCIFQDVLVNGEIEYINQTVSGSSEMHTEFNFGGIVGIASNCEFIDNKSYLTQKLVYGRSNGSSVFGSITMYAGGITGVSSGCKFLRCESTIQFNNTLYGYEASSYYTNNRSSGFYCSGITGYDNSSNSSITSCYSTISSNLGYYETGNYHVAGFYTMGFGNFSGYIEDSVSTIKLYEIKGHPYSWVSSGYKTNHLITDNGEYNKNKLKGGCYINNDISGITSMLSSDDKKINGNATYTRAQMNTQDFVDELNFYSRIHMDGEEHWKIKNGNLRLIHKEYDYNGLEAVKVDDQFDESCDEYFRLDGVRISQPSAPGIYIRRNGSKTSKILIK